MMLKRVFDLLVSGFAVVLVAPILLVIGLAIKLDSRGSSILPTGAGRPIRSDLQNS